jgi:hypothetical protein
MSCDFPKILESVQNHKSETTLEDNGLETQRTHLRVKTLKNWLILEMIQPTFTIYKN